MRALGKKHSPKTKAKMSEARLRYLHTAGFELMGVAPTRWGEIPFRSTWELATLWWMESDRDVETLRYEAIRVPYVYMGVPKWYVPDFLVQGREKTFVVEVKPKTFVRKDLKTRLKFEAAELYCRARNWTFIVISETELRASAFPRFVSTGTTPSTTYQSQVRAIMLQTG